MSGGYFEYKQHHINDIIDELLKVKNRINLEPKYNEEYQYLENNSLKDYVEDIPKFDEEVDKAIKYLKLASIYTQRIDWFLSGDDGEESFYRRLKEDLTKEYL